MSAANQADRILDLLDHLLGPAQALVIARDSSTNQVLVRAESTHRGVSVRDALAQYLQTKVGQ